jgi:hypothetical protein
MEKSLRINCVRDASMLPVPAVCALSLGSLCRIYTVVGLGGGVYKCQGYVTEDICVIVFMGPLFVYQFVLLFIYVNVKVFFYVHEPALSRVIYFLHNVLPFCHNSARYLEYVLRIPNLPCYILC